MESNIETLKVKREKILEGLIKKINSWDKTYELGIKIIDSVEVSLNELQEINKSIEASIGIIPFDGSYEKGILQVQKDYKILIDKLDIERGKLLELIKETRLKEKVKNNYILKENKSVFIDKDL